MHFMACASPSRYPRLAVHRVPSARHRTFPIFKLVRSGSLPFLLAFFNPSRLQNAVRRGEDPAGAGFGDLGTREPVLDVPTAVIGTGEAEGFETDERHGFSLYLFE